MKRLALFWILLLGLAAYAHADANRDFHAGVNAFGKGFYDESIRLFTKALESGDLSAEQKSLVLMNRAQSWEKKKDFERALGDFSQAVELTPKSPNAYVGRGAILSRQGQHDAALEDFARALQLKPDWGDLHVSRAGVYMAKGDRDAAKAELQKALQMDPQNKKARFYLSELERRN